MNNLIKEYGKKGYITYKYKNKYIYSYYDPINEAKKFIHSLKKINKYVITCCGADYINSQILDSYNNIELIICFEPIKFETDIISDKIVRINSIQNIEKILLEKNIHAKDITLIIWQPLIESLPGIYLEPLKILKDILYKTSISSNTAKIYGFLETKNILINLLNLNQLKIINQNNRKIDNPAVIISSGVSLKENIFFLQKIIKKSYIFALPSSLPFIDHENITPDFIVAVDPGYATLFHLSKYKKNSFLIGHLGINPSIINIKNYSTLFFNYNSFLENILYENNTDILFSPPEGSAFINLLRLLPQLGFKEVIIIGQDFGYKDNRSHINEGFFEKEFLSWCDYFHSLEYFIKKLEDSMDKVTLKIDQKEIISTIQLKLYFEHFIKNKFSIDILLPKTCFNPISDKIKKIDYEYIIKKYPDKKPIKEIFLFENYGDFNIKKKNVLNLIDNFIKKSNKTENDKKNIANNIFFDFNNKLHLNKLLKLSKAINC